MQRIRSAAASTLLVVLTSVSAVHAEETAVLYDDQTGIRSDVTVTPNELQVVTDDGEIYVYERDAEHDGRQSYCYYNAALDQALRWPLDKNDPLQILKPGAVRYQRSEMRILNRRGTIDDNAPGGPRPDDLAAYLYDAADGSAPRGQFQLARLQTVDDGVFNAELIGWDHVEYEYTVEVPVTIESIVNGRVQRIREMRTETRTALRPRLALSTLTLSFEQMTAFLPNGTRLTNETLGHLIAAGAPAVMVPDSAPYGFPNLQLDERVLRLLGPSTPIITYDSQATPSPPRFPSPAEAGRDFPKTPIALRGARIMSGGEIEISDGHYEMREQTITVEVPVTETRVVNGRTVEVATVAEEQQTRTIPVWHSTTIPYPAGEYELYDLSGRPLAPDEAAQPLAVPQTVIFLRDGEQLDPWYRNLLKSRTLVAVGWTPGNWPQDPNWSPIALPAQP